MKEIRLLRADEIDARISICNSYGVGILLYKDARCDMNILDETFGPMNWQRSHSRENRNCTVSIYDADKGQWVSKEDTGTESYTEAEKGLASDSFKRACFNWGIGRELYTAPKIFVGAKDLKTLKEDKGRWTCRDFFRVVIVQYSGRKLCYVAIRNEKTGKLLEFGEPVDPNRQTHATETQVQALRNTIKKKGIPEDEILHKMSMDGWGLVTVEQYNSIVELIRSGD